MAERIGIHCRIIGWIVILLCCIVIPFTTGCGGKRGDSITDQVVLLPTQLVASTDTIHYKIPGMNANMGVYCINAADRPDKPVYVWDVSLDGIFLESIVQDNGQPTNNEEMPEIFWPNGVHLNYEVSKTGTYTFEVKLYEYREYHKDKSTATLYSSYTHTVYCEPLKIYIEVTPESSARHYYFKAVAANPKFIPAYNIPSWQFIDQSTGLPDKGMTTNISGENDLWLSGIHEVTHIFPGTGSYLVVFMLEDAFDYFARVEKTVEINSEFTIIVPSESFKTAEEYTFTAWTDTPETLPDDVYYVWDFGDGPELTIPFNNECTHVFTDAGSYAIHVGVFEPGDAADMPIGSAIVTLNVEASANYLAAIHQMKKLHFVLSLSSILKDGSKFTDSFSPQIKDVNVLWDGVDFHMEWDRYNHKGSVTGHVSTDGTILERLKIRNEFKADGGEIQWTEVELANLPFWEDPMPERFSVDISDEDVGNYVVNYSNYRTSTYSWDDEAFLQIRFSRE